jgi:hypothetical protein
MITCENPTNKLLIAGITRLARTACDIVACTTYLGCAQTLPVCMNMVNYQRRKSWFFGGKFEGEYVMPVCSVVMSLACLVTTVHAASRHAGFLLKCTRLVFLRP